MCILRVVKIYNILELWHECPVIQVGDAVLNCLLYADDMVLIADSEDNLQSMLYKMFEWCSRWRLMVNKDKT